MQRGIFLSFILFAVSLCGVSGRGCTQVVPDSNWMESVKTVTLYKNGVELEYPVLALGGEDRLLLRFDVLGSEVGNYRYRIRHCDSQWQPDEMQPYEFVNGFDEGTIDNYNNSFTTLTDYVNYFQYIPEPYSRLQLSGNYVVTVYMADEPDSVLLTRRFVVVEGSLKADVSVMVPYDNTDIFERREVDVTVSPNADYRGDMLVPSLNPAYLKVMVRQNGRLDNERELTFSGYDRGNLCYRNKPENVFRCGNGFRYFDISNLWTAMYNVQHAEEYGGAWYALLKPLEDRSSKPFATEQTLNGGMKVNVWDRTNKQTEADYAYVNFLLPMKYPFMNGNVYVVGDLTQWRLDEHSRMNYDVNRHAYMLRLLLKQGYYAYQLLFVPVGEHEGLTATLEGDHYETPNDYYVYVYYRSPNDRYDRLVSYRKICGGM